jgi:hypothetical protein
MTCADYYTPSWVELAEYRTEANPPTLEENQTNTMSNIFLLQPSYKVWGHNKRILLHAYIS